MARGERSSVYERHVRESLAIAEYLAPRAGERWLDLGTGGGLPGLVLAIVFPTVSWSLLDATAKKVAEVQRFADALGLGNVDTVHGRAEVVARGDLRGACAGVVSRAVGPLATVAELARGFLGHAGVLAAVKGRSWEADLASAQSALQQLRFADVHSAAVASALRRTWLVTMRAVGPPPPAYPRRDGLPRSQPLGGTAP